MFSLPHADVFSLPQGSRQRQRRRKGPAEPMPPGPERDAKLSLALELLMKSYRVGEDGIDAIEGKGMEVAGKENLSLAVNAAAYRLWCLTHINTFANMRRRGLLLPTGRERFIPCSLALCLNCTELSSSEGMLRPA